MSKFSLAFVFGLSPSVRVLIRVDRIAGFRFPNRLRSTRFPRLFRVDAIHHSSFHLAVPRHRPFANDLWRDTFFITSARTVIIVAANTPRTSTAMSFAVRTRRAAFAVSVGIATAHHAQYDYVILVKRRATNRNSGFLRTRNVVIASMKQIFRRRVP